MLRISHVEEKPRRLPPVYAYRTHPLLPLGQALEPLLSQIDQLAHFIRIAREECHFPSEHGLTREESASIYLYTMDWGDQSLYRALNAALREKDRSVLTPWNGYIKLFDTALEKLPGLAGSVWRGINIDVSTNYKEDDKFNWWFFNSCSSKVQVVKQFLGSVSTLFMIETKNGKAISTYSNFPAEHEVILPLGTRLCVASDVLGHAAMNVVHLEEITDAESQGVAASLSKMHIDTVTKSQNGPKQASPSGQPSNFQTINYSDGNKYEGECKDGKRNGKGTYYFADGKKYVGDWVDDQKSGNGVQTRPSGARYEGQWKDDKRNGKGTYYCADGRKYVGDWVDAQKSGNGVFTWPSGDRYEGQWKDGKINGKGTHYYADGQVQKGSWSDGTFIG